jgi:hypothetical protein
MHFPNFLDGPILFQSKTSNWTPFSRDSTRLNYEIKIEVGHHELTIQNLRHPTQGSVSSSPLQSFFCSSQLRPQQRDPGCLSQDEEEL